MSYIGENTVAPDGCFEAFSADHQSSCLSEEDATSPQLIRRLIEDKPDVVFIKGHNYRLIQEAVAALPNETPVIAIVGGTIAIGGPIDSRIDQRLSFEFLYSSSQP